jgi:hypothetical protein
MTGQHDHDSSARDVERRLAAFLGDPAYGGAPERVVEAAVAHARTHPRRRDGLAAFRPDPMDGWGSVVGLGPVGGVRAGRVMPRLLLVASLGLLLVAAFAVASVGGWFDRPSVVPPGESPSPVPTVSPPVSPSLPPVESIQVDLTELYGSDAFVDITDESRTLLSAVTGTPQDGGSTDGTSVVVTQGASADTLVLTWTGLPCDAGHELTIEPDGRTMALTRPTCEGDTFPRDLVLELTFDGPVVPADLTISLETIEG